MLLESFLFFGLFFLSAVVIVIVFLYLYAIVTPYDDYKLIFQENNSAASIGFGGAIVGLCIPLYSALVSSVSYVDFIIWAVVAMVIQLLFALVVTRLNNKFSFEKLINEGVTSVGVLMAFLSISIGLLNAGSMSY
jgi:putative membrane protein